MSSSDRKRSTLSAGTTSQGDIEYEVTCTEFPDPSSPDYFFLYLSIFLSSNCKRKTRTGRNVTCVAESQCPTSLNCLCEAHLWPLPTNPLPIGSGDTYKVRLFPLPCFEWCRKLGIVLSWLYLAVLCLITGLPAEAPVDATSACCCSGRVRACFWGGCGSCFCCCHPPVEQ